MTQPLGLSTYQWNNNLKSMVLLAAFPALLVGVVALFFAVTGWLHTMPDGTINRHTAALVGLHPNGANDAWTFTKTGTLILLPYILGIATLWLGIGFLFNDSLIRMASRAKSITRKQQPLLYNLLENLCISRGIAMPKLYIMDTPVMNAFASGLNTSSYAITVTQGLLDRLEKDELEAVLAHELSHIINRDVRLLIITVLFTGMLGFFAEMMWRSMYRAPFSVGGRRTGRSNGFLLLIAALVLFAGYLVSILLRFALSRRREYLADAGAIELTKRPDAMIRALDKISGNASLPGVPSGIQAMLIENPPSFISLFATHPPIEARISILRRLGGLPRQRPSVIPRTK